jgi:hypothetical protein
MSATAPNCRESLPPSRAGLRRRARRPTRRNSGCETARGEELYSAPSVGAGFGSGKGSCRNEDLCSTAASPVRANRDQLCGACARPAAQRMSRDTGRPIEQSPVHHRHCLRLGLQQPRLVLPGVSPRVWRQAWRTAQKVTCLAPQGIFRAALGVFCAERKSLLR